jgi:hypothetical protein
MSSPRVRAAADDDGRRAVKVRISLIAIACAAVTAVLGVSSAKAADKSYCIDGATVTITGTTALDALHQFQLDGFATFGGAYTKAGNSQSLVDALSDFTNIPSAFPPFGGGGIFHPVAAGACAASTPPVGPGSASPSASVSAPRGEDGIFLCYSKFQVDPGVWGYSQAQQLLAGGGYWKPYAVIGTDSSTRVGPYSLVCNPGGVAPASASSAGVQDGGDFVTLPLLLDQLSTYLVYP